MWKKTAVLLGVVLSGLWLSTNDYISPNNPRPLPPDFVPLAKGQTPANIRTVTASDIVHIPVTNDCPSLAQVTAQLLDGQRQRRLLSAQLLTHYQQQGLQSAVLLEELVAIGGDMQEFLQRDPQSWSKLSSMILLPKQPLPLPRTEQLLLAEAGLRRDYQQVLHWLQQLPDPQLKQRYTAQGLSLLSLLLVFDPQLPLHTVQQLIDAGLTPQLSDLVLVTMLQRPLQLVDLIQLNSQVNISEPWLEQHKVYNLTLLAAQLADNTLFDYWLAQGVPAQDPATILSAFDYLPLPDSQQALEHLLPMVRSLLRLGLIPLDFAAQSRWLLLLPATEANQLAELLQNYQLAASAQESPASQQLTQALFELNQQQQQLLQQSYQCHGLAALAPLPLAPTEQPIRPSLAQRLQKMAWVERASPEQLALTLRLFTQERLLQQGQFAEYIQQMEWQHAEMPPAELELLILNQLLLYAAPASVILQRLEPWRPLPVAFRRLLQQEADPVLFQRLRQQYPYLRQRTSVAPTGSNQ